MCIPAYLQKLARRGFRAKPLGALSKVEDLEYILSLSASSFRGREKGERGRCLARDGLVGGRDSDHPPSGRQKSRCRPSWDSYMCIADSDYLQADRDKRFRYFPSPPPPPPRPSGTGDGGSGSALQLPHLVIACFIFLSVFFFSYGQTRWNPGLKSWRFRNSNHLPEGSANLREAAHARSS